MPSSSSARGPFRILIATEAAGEGHQPPSLQHPVQLRHPVELGRIHRYGQRKDRLIFNFVATSTRQAHPMNGDRTDGCAEAGYCVRFCVRRPRLRVPNRAP
jgi:hypothetical protein